MDNIAAAKKIYNASILEGLFRVLGLSIELLAKFEIQISICIFTFLEKKKNMLVVEIESWNHWISN
uniref:Uncharacterized protein n=1 Tax=Megaselia scalaris TaxID=36166 RepID=T1GEB4_MEGSC